MSYPSLRKLLVIPVLLAVLLLAGMALVPIFISTDLVRVAVERQITDFAGRPVSLGGPTEVTLFPNPKAVLRDVTISGSNGFPPLARVETMTVEMSLASLMRGHAKVTGVHLVQPFIHIVTDGERRDAIDYMPVRDIRNVVAMTREQRAAERAEGTSTNGNGTRRALIWPEGMDLRGGTLTFERGRGLFERTGDVDAGNRSLTFRNLNGRLDWPRLDGPVRLNATMETRGIEVGASFETPHPLDLLAGVEAPLELSVNSQVGGLQFSGAGGYLAGIFGGGSFSFRSEALGTLLETIGLTGARERLTETLSASGRVVAQGNKLRFDEIELVAEGSKGNGIAELVISENGPPALTATLDFDALDLRALLSAFTPLPDASAWDTAINLGFMDRVRTDMRLSARNASFGQLAFQQLAAGVRTTPQLALFDIGDAMTAGGRATARLRFERSAVGEPTIVNLAASGEYVDFSSLKSALPVPDFFPQGRGDFALRLDAEADRWNSITERGDGMLKLSMQTGTLPGLSEVTQVAQSETRGVRQMDLGLAGPGFEALKLSGPISDGVLRLEEGRIDYGDDTAISVRGYMPIDGGGLAMTGTHEGADGTQSRFFIGGSLERPYLLPVLSSRAPDRTVD